MEGSIQAASNDVANLETLMTEELDRLSRVSPSRCIFRVPDRLRRVREEAYTPRLISIGPLHHGKEALKAMEEHKKRYLQHFLGRTSKLSLKDCIKIIKDHEAKLRSCYSETIELKSDEFVRIILVDAIFIIEFLFRCSYAELDENDCIFGEPRMAHDIWPDLLMLENQLPFFILEKLFDPHIFLAPSMYRDRLHGVERFSILFLSRNFLDGGSSTFQGILDNLETIYSSEAEVQHFVDLLRKLCIGLTPAPILKKQSPCLGFPLCQRRKKKHSKHTTSPSIAELHLAGVKFKVRSTKNLFDIQFVDGFLEIPELKAEDFTEIILRNLVAFEQCTYKEQYYISDYVSIMDKFVDTPKDVELLVKYKIVENFLGGGDKELSTMINNLSTGVICDPMNFCYGTLCEKLNEFCSSKWNKRVANLRQLFQYPLGNYVYHCSTSSPHTHYGSNNLLDFLSSLSVKVFMDLILDNKMEGL